MNNLPIATPEEIAIRKDVLEDWLRRIQEGIRPQVPFDKDHNKMLLDAYEFRGGVLTIIASQIRARGVILK